MQVPDTTKMAVNYGLDRVRFLAPVRAGNRVRGHFTSTASTKRRPANCFSDTRVTVEIEDAGQARPHRPVARPHFTSPPGEPPCPFATPSSSPPPAPRSAAPIRARSTPRPRRRSPPTPSAPRSSAPGSTPPRSTTCIIGAALQQGVQATIGRTAALRAGLPVTVAGMTIDRQCASGLMAIATAAKQVIVDRMDVCVAGGVESISMVQTPEMRLGPDMELLAMHKDRLHADDRHRRSRRQALRHQPRGVRRICARSRSSAPPPRRPKAASPPRSSQSPPRWASRTRKPARSRCTTSRSTRTRATAPTPRSKARQRSSRSAAKAISSPPATPASSATAPRPAW